MDAAGPQIFAESGQPIYVMDRQPGLMYVLLMADRSQPPRRIVSMVPIIELLKLLTGPALLADEVAHPVSSKKTVTLNLLFVI